MIDELVMKLFNATANKEKDEKQKIKDYMRQNNLTDTIVTLFSGMDELSVALNLKEDNLSFKFLANSINN